MSLVVGQQMSADQARALTDRIRAALTVAYESLIEAWQGRADLALGYETWDDYCSQEFAEGRMVRLDREQRREIVGQMAHAGMTTRAIAAGLDLPHRTVARDAAGAGVPSGTRRTGMDGKVYLHTNRGPVSESPFGESAFDSGPARDEDDGPPLTQEECEALDGPTGTGVPTQARQRPLTEVAKDAGWELRRAVDKIERVLADSRLTRNAEQVTNALRGHLLDAAERVPSALDRLSTNHRKDTVL